MAKQLLCPYWLHFIMSTRCLLSIPLDTSGQLKFKENLTRRKDRPGIAPFEQGVQKIICTSYIFLRSAGRTRYK
jgi:hypothetical protein